MTVIASSLLLVGVAMFGLYKFTPLGRYLDAFFQEIGSSHGERFVAWRSQRRRSSPLEGYKLQDSAEDTVRVFGDVPLLIPEFEVGMNGCLMSKWRMRWRSDSPISVGLAYYNQATSPQPLRDVSGPSTTGEIVGTQCDQPVLFIEAPYLANVAYESERYVLSASVSEPQ